MGPGQYNLKDKRNSLNVFQTTGSSCFKVQPRADVNNIAKNKNPGPGNYQIDPAGNLLGPNGKKSKNNGVKPAFGVKTNRFGSDETLPPGPGNYPAPDSC